MSEVAAVVVTYNRKKLLQICIEKIKAQKNISCDIYVIDNASTDGTSEMIRERYRLPFIRYFNTGSNIGGAGGFEYGLKRAVEAGYRFVWMMDDDTFPEDTALFELMEAGKQLPHKWGFLSSAAYWTDGSICQANVQKSNIFHRIKPKEYQNREVKVMMASFVSLFVNAEVVKEVGYPIGEYFIWTDDYEFTGRISQKYPGYVIPSSRVVHAMKVHKRAKIACENEERIDRYHYLFRNDVHCYRQYGLLGWSYIVLKDGYTCASILISSKKNRLCKLKIVCNGFKEGLHFHPELN